MPRRAKGLSAARVKTAKPGTYFDGGGLVLTVRSAEARFWTFLYTSPVTRKRREMGLGSASGRDAVSLADARDKARDLRAVVKSGRDPLIEREAGCTLSAIAKASATTFEMAAQDFIAAHEAGWRSAKHRLQWRSTLQTYAFPVLGPLPVGSIDTNLVMKVLGPLWSTKAETAGRLRGRIEQVLDRAKVLGLREGENPARWRGHLDKLLPALSKVAKPKRRPALPYAEVGDFMTALRVRQSTAARALEFAILSSARAGEALGARFSEINLAEKIWTVPGERMKSGVEHVVPLSPRAIEILQALPRKGEFVFPGYYTSDRPLSDGMLIKQLRAMGRGDLSVHGFRSTFRTWAAEQTNYRGEVAEAALAHTQPSAVVAAYNRTTYFDRRRQLMDEWAVFCAQPSRKKISGKVVVPMRGKAGAK